MVQLVTGKVVKLFEFDRCELIARDRSRCRATPLLGAAGRELPEPTRAREIMPRLSAPFPLTFVDLLITIRSPPTELIVTPPA